MTDPKTVIEAARRAERAGLMGDSATFVGECLTLSSLTRGRESLTDEEAVAMTDASVSVSICDIAQQIARAAEGFVRLEQPIHASAFLSGPMANPILSLSPVLRETHARIRESLAHIETFSAFAEKQGSLPPTAPSTTDARVQAEIAAIRAEVTRIIQERGGPVRVLSVGGGALVQETAVSAEFGDAVEFSYCDLSAGGSNKPASWFDFPKREGGYDLVVCLNAIQEQPNPAGFLAFLHEQCAHGVYSVPEPLRGPVNPMNVHSFNEPGLRALFDLVGLEGLRVSRTPDGFVIGVL